MSDWPFQATYWVCSGGHKMPKRTMSNMFSDPTEYLSCLYGDDTYEEGRTIKEGSVKWTWRCSKCQGYVSWKLDFCHNPTCDGTWLAHGSQKLDGKTPSKYPDPYEKPSEEEIKKSQEKIKKGEKHRPIPGCPEGDCKGPHAFTFRLYATVDPAPIGQPISVWVDLDPAIDPQAPEAQRGTLDWELVDGYLDPKADDGSLVAWFVTEEEIDKPVWGQTDGSVIEQKVVRMIKGDLKLKATFTYGSHPKDKRSKTLVVPFRELQREPGEREASKTSPFVLEPLAAYRPPRYVTGEAEGKAGTVIYDNSKHVRAWILHDFEVGESELPAGKLPQGLRTVLQPLTQRLNEVIALDGPLLGPHSTHALRFAYMEGHADALGPPALNLELRKARRLAFLAAVKKAVPGLSRTLYFSTELEDREKKAILKLGTYPSSNADAAGRARNRSIVLVEVLRNYSEQGAAEERDKLLEEADASIRSRLEKRLPKLGGWYDTLGTLSVNDTVLTCMLAKVRGQHVHLKATAEAYLAGSKTWSRFQRDYCRGAPDVEVFFTHRDVEQMHNLTDAAIAAGSEGGYPSLQNYCHSVTTWLLGALLIAGKEEDAKALFLKESRRLVAVVHAGYARLQRFRVYLGGGAGEDNHYASKLLVGFMKRSYQQEPQGVYACDPITQEL